ncbi:DUF2029 domain-containing protein [Conexibacter sp. W3-3-2]|uniref:glycosyltransferase 87 family protein n=1 Tax=Conexibacter sp. W3-3-2 TaxID=2675227 RepID=UPI0012B844F0|nr:glycosyltransferase 87 family protein [Conexibacter sp. W3-3-2]MTD45563.1 DUF2029 domain-containing protein [Conexibacter sp. W3-3-2]
MSHAGRLLPALALAVTFTLVTTVGPLADDSISDLFVYRTYADAVLHGARPYADLGFEYPPLALGPLVLPGIGGASADAFAWRFGALMLLAALVVQALVGALGGRRAAWLLVALPLLTGALLRTRFDLVPVALLLGGLVLVARDRPTAGLAVLGLGTATKLFPVVAAALVLVHLDAVGRRRDAVRGAVAFALVLAAACLPFAGPGFLDQFRFHLERPVQIESTPASVLWALGDSAVTGDPVRPDRFKSNGLDGGPADLVAALSAVALAATLLAVAVLTHRARDRPGTVDRAVLAGLLAFVALGKVLSPQYLVWLLPLAALAWTRGDRGPAVLVTLAAVATLAYFPGDYFALVDGDGGTFALVAARNALLLAATVLAVRALSRPAAASTAAAPARSRPRAAAATPAPPPR